MQFFDLNFVSLNSSYNPPQHCLRRDGDEFGENGLCATDSVSAEVRVQSMRESLSGQLQSKEFLMPRSVALHGVRAVDLSRKPARYRNVSELTSPETLSYGHPGQDRQIYLGGCQRASRLSDLSGLRVRTHQRGQFTLPKRRTWLGPKTRDLCLGLNGYRSVSLDIPVGHVSKEEGSCQDPCAAQCPGIDSDLYFRHSRKRSRRQYDGCRSYKSRFGLYHGPCLSRFRTALSYQSALGLLRDPDEAQSKTSSYIFCTGRQNHRNPSRSNRCARRVQLSIGLSRSYASGSLLRYQTGQAPRVSYQQLPSASEDCSGHLSVAMAGGAILQVDKATPTDQVVLWHLAQRSQNPDLDRRQRLSSRGDCQEAFEPPWKPPHNSTDFGGEPV